MVTSVLSAALALAGLSAAHYIPYPKLMNNGAPLGPALSDLGLHSLNLPDFLGDPRQGQPWGSRTSRNTDYYDYSQIPDTGVTQYYDWTFTRGQIAPDGVEITGIMVNGQFPGPLLEANWGDWVEVKVTNNIPDEGASVHWHGIIQTGTQSFDGVPGVSQCPIAPGTSMTYRWRANMYGSSWWHSHYSSQYGSGLLGPMVIYGPQNQVYDIDVGPIMAGDWYHQYYTEGVDQSLLPVPHAVQPSANNVLINGKNNYDCSLTDLPCVANAGQASFNFTSGKVHRLRLVNPSAASTMKISLDEHIMTVIANDFVEVQPYNTTVVTLGVGQRTDVLVYGSGQSNSTYYLRAYMPPNCSPSDNNAWNVAKAVIYYENANRMMTPASTPAANWNSQYCGNDDLSLTEPMMAMPVSDPSYTQDVIIQFLSNGTVGLWYQNERTMRIDYNSPLLAQAKNGTVDFEAINNVYNFGSNKSVRFIFENHSGMVHPMHLHGHNLLILNEGICADSANYSALASAGVMNGQKMDLPTATAASQIASLPTSITNPPQTCWNGTVIRPENPQRRDVQQLLPGGYIAVQWAQDNPGVWPFHCHIAWHISQGFALFVLEQPDEIVSSVATDGLDQTCPNWMDYTNSNVVEDDDSGI